MTVAELKQKLDEEGILPGEYSINGERSPDTLVLEKRGNDWIVFSLDRYIERDLKVFVSEDYACQYVYEHMVRLYSHFDDAQRKRFKAFIKK